MKPLILFFISVFLSTTLSSQCGDRYQEVLFDEVNVETVVYSTYNNFEMDIYTPVGDEVTERPVLILAFGGGFFFGFKESKLMQDLCTDFAKRGYVTASINYTLLNNISELEDSVLTYTVVAEAVADGKGAIRYFRKSHAEGNPYGIDPDQIWIGGNSAGAVLALHLAYLDENDDLPEFLLDIINESGGFEGNRGNDGYSSKVNGIISLAGGIGIVDWIDENEDEVAIMIHGDADGTVDFNCNYPFSSAKGVEATVQLCGSNPISQRAKEIGLPHHFKVLEGYDHVPWQFGADNIAIYAETFEFVNDALYGHLYCNISSTSKIGNDPIVLFPNPVRDRLSIKSNNNDMIERVEIYNTQGQLVNFEKFHSNQIVMDNLEVNPGIYLVKTFINGIPKIEKVLFH